MKAFTRTFAITVLVALVLAAEGFAQRRSVPAVSVEVEPPGAVAPPTLPVMPTPSVASAVPVAANRRWIATTRSRQAGTGAVLVIPSTEMKPEDIVALMEDMTIMARIFDDRLAQERLISPSSGVIWNYRSDVFSKFFSRDSHATEAIYLEGFGSLFLIGVDFPLSAPPEVQAEQADQGVDPVWNQMKREIYYPDDTSRRKRQEEQKEYDADKVQDLQRTLVRALKHAANIRGLKSDEWVTIMVRGGEVSMILTATNTGRTTGGKIVTQQAAHPEPTFLTIRAQKTDIDSFAKDKLPYDQFRQRVQTIIY